MTIIRNLCHRTPEFIDLFYLSVTLYQLFSLSGYPSLPHFFLYLKDDYDVAKPRWREYIPYGKHCMDERTKWLHLFDQSLWQREAETVHKRESRMTGLIKPWSWALVWKTEGNHWCIDGVYKFWYSVRCIYVL